MTEAHSLPAPLTGARSASRRVLIARLGAERIAIDIIAVSEVLDAPHVKRLPLMPAGVAGQMAYRGDYLTVLDPAVVLGVPRVGGEGAALVLANAAAALWVDDAEDVWEASELEQRSVPVGTDRLGILRGLLSRGDQVVSLVDAGALTAAALATLRQGTDR